VKGPWPAPVVDGVEAVAAKYAEACAPWGHGKIAALMRADGHTVSTSTVERALRRRGAAISHRRSRDQAGSGELQRVSASSPPATRKTA
jgi:putative transposase